MIKEKIELKDTSFFPLSSISLETLEKDDEDIKKLELSSKIDSILDMLTRRKW